MTSKILGIKISVVCKSPANLRLSFGLKSKIQKAKVHFPLMLFSILIALQPASAQQTQNQIEQEGVAVLLVDTDRKMGNIDENLYGHFLEHINHSVVDGLYAEKVRGQGFEGKDFETFWKVSGKSGLINLIETPFKNGLKSVQFKDKAKATLIQDRIYLKQDQVYNGSFWVNVATSKATIFLRFKDKQNQIVSEIKKEVKKGDWQEVTYDFTSKVTDENCTLEIAVSGNVMFDFISLMDKNDRANGMMRQDLFQSLQALKPPFIRWPGGSFASIYHWKDGIGPQVNRTYHPNTIWGGYSDYYGFGTEEFLNLCDQLGSDPMIVLKATSTDPKELEYAMDWVHYLIDPQDTEWGKLRAKNGHPEPYRIPYFQIDNEPMNHLLSPEKYAEIVNLYGSRLRAIAPNSKIVACGQKRSNDMIWSQKVIDIAGENFDVLGCHNYEYEPENFQTGVRRIEDYIVKLKDYIHHSKHPDIIPTILEWGLCRSYDWRAGLHAAGSLISYEKTGITMSCPALLMRNVEDDPTWTAWVYHDHVSWFPGGGYVVEKLFRDYYEPVYLSAISGTFRDISDRKQFFDDISQMKPEDWTPGTVDAIATTSLDGKRIIIKAVNYSSKKQTLLTRLQGKAINQNGKVASYTVSAEPMDKASLDQPDLFAIEKANITFAKDLNIKLKPYSVVVIEVKF
ncbi:MAG TPA: carbohydrate binding domain-containing protein [Saprospiraceae bacterium]|nr:carbohydrate binding domain-containing protein [Saprospiraceae bacterium]